ncbi:GNAT family N-acetyltransferase [Clostridium sp. DSM 8431]|uniref:GNAT family N-acetyltransferase n=1 Tax=Clostridium sp. DSM 8431 TaxID=1761781 RepID=UPI0015878F39
MMNFNGTETIVTERLVLRKVEINDAEDMFYNWASDKEVTKNLTWPAHNSIEVSKKVISMWLEDYKKQDNYQWGIELKDTGKLIGCISVVSINESIEEAALGYCIGKKFWNKGIMTEALKAVIDYLFKKVGFNRIEAYHNIDNIASGKVMIKAGMQYEGIRRAGCKDNNGRYVDVKVYSILKDEIEC